MIWEIAKFFIGLGVGFIVGTACFVVMDAYRSRP